MSDMKRTEGLKGMQPLEYGCMYAGAVILETTNRILEAQKEGNLEEVKEYKDLFERYTGRMSEVIEALEKSVQANLVWIASWE